MSLDNNFLYLTCYLILLLLDITLAHQFFSYSVQHLM